MPPFLSFLLAKVFDFSVLWVATNAALVNIHSCKVSTERNVAGGEMPATLLQEVVPMFTWEHLEGSVLSV